MPDHAADKVGMLYDRENSSEQCLMEALRIAGEHRNTLYIIGASEAPPVDAAPGWTPLPADKVAEDLVAMARLAQQHGLKVDGSVVTDPDSGRLCAIIRQQGIAHIVRMHPGTPGAARDAWAEAWRQAAETLDLRVTDMRLVDTARTANGP